jgi:hypothetical protein
LWDERHRRRARHDRTFAESTLRCQRWLPAAMLLGSAVVILPPAVEPSMLPKVTLLLLLGVALAGLVAARALVTRQVGLPVVPVVWAVLAVVLALVMTTLTSSTPWASIVRFYGRYTGLVPYPLYVGVFLVAIRCADERLAALLLRTGLVALGLVVAYGSSRLSAWTRWRSGRRATAPRSPSSGT